MLFKNMEIFNIGNNKPVALKDFIDAVETSCGKRSNKSNVSYAKKGCL